MVRRSWYNNNNNRLADRAEDVSMWILITCIHWLNIKWCSNSGIAVIQYISVLMCTIVEVIPSLQDYSIIRHSMWQWLLYFEDTSINVVLWCNELSSKMISVVIATPRMLSNKSEFVPRILKADATSYWDAAWYPSWGLLYPSDCYNHSWYIFYFRPKFFMSYRHD